MLSVQDIQTILYLLLCPEFYDLVEFSRIGDIIFCIYLNTVTVKRFLCKTIRHTECRLSCSLLLLTLFKIVHSFHSFWKQIWSKIFCLSAELSGNNFFKFECTVLCFLFMQQGQEYYTANIHNTFNACEEKLFSLQLVTIIQGPPRIFFIELWSEKFS